MRTIIVGDIHGCYKEFCELLKKTKFGQYPVTEVTGLRKQTSDGGSRLLSRAAMLRSLWGDTKLWTLVSSTKAMVTL